MRVADAEAFVLDLDGTLVRRSATGLRPLPGAVELLYEVRRSGRPLVVFTNASHTTPAQLAAGVRAAGLPVLDREVLTPVCSALRVFEREHPQPPTLAIATPQAAQRLAAAGVPLLPSERATAADVVFTAHADDPGLDLMEAAAQAVISGARFLTANFASVYAGARGPVISRGAMIAAAIAKAAGTAPTVVGKPSYAAVRLVSERLGVPLNRTLVVGDDIGMDVALGHLGGAGTVLVRTGLGSAGGVLVEPAARPDLVVDDVGALIDLL
jgi:NagD protein